MATAGFRKKHRGAVTLAWNRLDLEIDADKTDAPTIYAQIVKRLAAERRIRYAELTFFGDSVIHDVCLDAGGCVHFTKGDVLQVRRAEIAREVPVREQRIGDPGQRAARARLTWDHAELEQRLLFCFA